jgi:outer membrane lipoprotein-sorting protein
MPKLTLRAVALVSLALVAGCHRAPAPVSTQRPAPQPRLVPAYANGEAVITAMRDRYAGLWYRTLTFRQKTSTLSAKGTWSAQTWYEAMRLPGRLRIDFDPIKAGNGVLYVRDSQFVVANFKVTRADPGINDLLLLGFDVYSNTTARTAALLRQQGIDLSRVHMDSFDGRSMIVVGALAGDTHRKQFWIDAQRLYFVRLLEPAPRDTTKLQDIRFVNYERHGDAWVAARVDLYNDGKLVFYEEYSDITLNATLDDALFDPSKWRTAKHWVAQ